jgi:hypothetical protein
MTFRTAHGKAGDAGALVVVETSPANELPAGVPAPPREERPDDRDESGRFQPGNSLAGDGARAKGNQTRLAAKLGLATLPDSAGFASYRRAAAAFRRAQCTELARTVGGGACGPGPSSIVASAALALAWSRYLSDKAAETGDGAQAVEAMRLADRSRTMLLTAHELCAREAIARAASAPGADYSHLFKPAPKVETATEQPEDEESKP